MAGQNRLNYGLQTICLCLSRPQIQLIKALWPACDLTDVIISCMLKFFKNVRVKCEYCTKIWRPCASSAVVFSIVCRLIALNKTISHPDIRLKQCAYGHGVATLLNPRGVTISHKSSLTVARHAAVVVAVPSTLHYTANYKIKIHYFRWNLKV
jgi:hypothetical protein